MPKYLLKRETDEFVESKKGLFRSQPILSFFLFASAQCDQIWQNFTILAKSWKIFDGLINMLENLGPTLTNLM